MTGKKDDRLSKAEPGEQQEKDLGDEHSYGFENDPAADDTIDNRMIVRSGDRLRSGGVGANQHKGSDTDKPGR